MLTLPPCLLLRRPPDNRVCVLGLPKAEYGKHWPRLFEGDTDGVRCMQPPYTLSREPHPPLAHALPAPPPLPGPA